MTTIITGPTAAARAEFIEWLRLAFAEKVKDAGAVLGWQLVHAISI